jgi:hypothetical protein
VSQFRAPLSQSKCAKESGHYQRCHHCVSQFRAPLSQSKCAKESGHYHLSSAPQAEADTVNGLRHCRRVALNKTG